MNTLKALRELWHPVTDKDRQTVLEELQEVLQSPHFSNSKRYPKFLRYVVQSSLDGSAHLLKERTIGVEVFGRPADYDTNADTVVRFTAGEVRKRLAMYYHEHETNAAVQISLPLGSYAPEFLRQEDEPGEENQPSHLVPMVADPLTPALPSAATKPEWVAPSPAPQHHPHEPKSRWSTRTLAALFSLGLLIGIGVALLFSRAWAREQTEVDRYWAPLFAQGSPILLNSGATMLEADRNPWPTTADRTTDYPFVSMQIVNAIVRVTRILERRGASYEVRSAPFLTLTDMRDRPTVLVGAYNNEWTMRLVNSLRFYFAPGATEAIVDREHPGTSWHRDPALPYANADDYALIGRFRDPTTDSIMYIVAGIGRNGTEAAAQFVTTPHDLELLKQQAGPNWASGNIEAVIKTRVIEGRTGAPSIIAVHVW